MIYKFYSDNCKLCQDVSPLLESYNYDLSTVKMVDIFDPDNDEIVDKYSISKVPSMLIIHDNMSHTLLTGLTMIKTYLSNLHQKDTFSIETDF